MSKTKALSLIVADSRPEQLEKFLVAYGAAAELHIRLKLLYQAAQGATLLALQEAYGFTRGNHGTAKTTACGFSSWPALVEKKYGFSDEKARRLMNRWKALAPLLEKLPKIDQQRIADFLRRPMAPLDPAYAKALEKVTHKISSLEDEAADLAECKFLVKRLKPHNPDPANNGADQRGADGVPSEEQLQLDFNELAKADDLFEATYELGLKKALKIELLPVVHLETLLEKRKAHVRILVKILNAKRGSK